MRILIIQGSYRTNGNTARILHLVTHHLQRLATSREQSIEIETVNLARQKIGQCRGCRLCFDRGEQECPLNDDLLNIKESMLAADGIIVATPVYVNDVNGSVKVWMDRLAHVNHRPEFAGKCAYLLATSGDGPGGHALKTLKMALSQWGFAIAGHSAFKMGALMRMETTSLLYQPQCETIAATLFRAVDERAGAKPSFLSLMTFKIQQQYWQRRRHDPLFADSLDLAYWKRQGWIAPCRDYFSPHKAGRLKVTVARVAGAILARYVT